MVSKGSFVKITYVGRVKETGELFDTTDEALARKEGTYAPNARYGSVTIVVGEGRVLRGLDEALVTMNAGDERTLDVPPEKAFGPRSAETIRLIPLKEFNRQGFTPAAGMQITMNSLHGRVLSVNSGRVRVDFNHPLAGKALTYVLRIDEEVTDKAMQARGLVDYYLRESADVKVNGTEAEVVHKEEIPQRAKEAMTEDLKKFVGLTGVKFTQLMESKAEKAPAQSSNQGL
ncbi:MAG: peptidylprolyl isomerase [Candidatus Aenigmarchaeota archaeon]|nr:peptidylprolyl isomerase [Candidatus Aenigmarchaeota archaeon]